MKHFFVPFFVLYFFQCIIVLSWNSLASYRYQELSVPQEGTLGRLKGAESVWPDSTFTFTSQQTDP